MVDIISHLCLGMPQIQKPCKVLTQTLLEVNTLYTLEIFSVLTDILNVFAVMLYTFFYLAITQFAPCIYLNLYTIFKGPFTRCAFPCAFPCLFKRTANVHTVHAHIIYGYSSDYVRLLFVVLWRAEKNKTCCTFIKKKKNQKAHTNVHKNVPWLAV